MRTGRPRRFCLEDVVDRAMIVFLHSGYKGSSMSELTAAMGINSPSLYACFGNKEGLFRAVLVRYEDRHKTFMADVLAVSDMGELAKRYLHGVADFAAHHSGKNPTGCLLLQNGLASAEENISEELARLRAEKLIMLRDKLEGAREVGELSEDADPASLARYLTAVSNGICVQAASGASAKELHDVADLALMTWSQTLVGLQFPTDRSEQ